MKSSALSSRPFSQLSSSASDSENWAFPTYSNLLASYRGLFTHFQTLLGYLCHFVGNFPKTRAATAHMIFHHFHFSPISNFHCWILEPPLYPEESWSTNHISKIGHPQIFRSMEFYLTTISNYFHSWASKWAIHPRNGHFSIISDFPSISDL